MSIPCFWPLLKITVAKHNNKNSLKHHSLPRPSFSFARCCNSNCSSLWLYQSNNKNVDLWCSKVPRTQATKGKHVHGSLHNTKLSLSPPPFLVSQKHWNSSVGLAMNHISSTSESPGTSTQQPNSKTLQSKMTITASKEHQDY